MLNGLATSQPAYSTPRLAPPLLQTHHYKMNQAETPDRAARARVIAYYLPQYHPIVENDEQWGPGFTEWTNVGKAPAMFPGHYQPRVPRDFGYYDLRVAETREAQARMAEEYGVEAFCYYHYWFAGHRLLERPFNEVLESGKPDFPFCLCWANHSWTGIWLGSPEHLIMEQTYPGMDDHYQHFQYLLKAFKDKRYVTVDGKPFFAVYAPKDIPNVKQVTDMWREEAHKAGLPGLHLVGINQLEVWKPEPDGFDASIAERLPPRHGKVSKRLPRTALHHRLRRKPNPTIYTYEEAIDFMVRPKGPDHEDYPVVLPNWDNTPRSGANGLVLHNSTPELFRKHLRKALHRVEKVDEQHRIVILKAWNEWGEGNYIEPDQRHGRAYLDVLKEELYS